MGLQWSMQISATPAQCKNQKDEPRLGTAKRETLPVDPLTLSSGQVDIIDDMHCTPGTRMSAAATALYAS